MKVNERMFIELYNAGKNSYELADIFKVSQRSVERYETRLRRQGKIKYRKDFLKPEPQKTTNDKKIFYENSIKVFNILREEVTKLTPYKIVKTSKKQKGDTLVIQLSDWHVGRIIKDEIGNIIYNEEIFKKRAGRLMDEMLRLVDNYIRKGTAIKDAVILSTGDIVDGAGIFATQEAMQELSPPFQVMSAVNTIQKLILSLLERKLSVYFYGVKGNHGEIRVNGKNTDPNANWDLMLYLILDYWNRTSLKNKNVDMLYSELDYLNFEIQGWKYHIRHIAPKQSETASGKAKFLGWAKKHNFDALVYGHYHHFGIFDRSGVTIFRGGSLTGSDEFAESLAEESAPTQLLWGVSQNRPLTFFYPVDLGKKQKKNIIQ